MPRCQDQSPQHGEVESDGPGLEIGEPEPAKKIRFQVQLSKNKKKDTPNTGSQKDYPTAEEIRHEKSIVMQLNSSFSCNNSIFLDGPTCLV